MAASATLFVAQSASADCRAVGPTAVTVPWVGAAPAVPHDILSGVETTLKGAEAALDDGTYRATRYKWNFGDGQESEFAAIANNRAISATHTYEGAPGSFFAASLTLCDAADACHSAEYRLIIRADSVETRTNIAIGKGLWYLHGTLQASGAFLPAGNYGNRKSSTPVGANAFFVHGHLETIDPCTSPYTNTVRAAMRYTFTNTATLAIGLQAGNDPDANGNGLGATVAGSRSQEVYENGMFIDAIVASGTPDALVTTGPYAELEVDGHPATYADVAQDFVDAYVWGQNDDGHWNYVFNNNGHKDNSSASWGAVGMLAAEQVWNLTVPQFMKDANLPSVLAMRNANGTFGYAATNCIWGCAAVTGGGLLQLTLDGINSDAATWQGSATWIGDNWGSGPGQAANGNIVLGYTYGMYGVVKALRSATPPMEAIPLSNGEELDWYNDPVRGLAHVAASRQNANGSWNTVGANVNISGMATQWHLVTNLFESPPKAVAAANPLIALPGQEVTFDHTGSFHVSPDKNLVTFDWDFDGDGEFDFSTNDINERPTHAFDVPLDQTPMVFTAVLRVTDDSDPAQIDTSSVDITVDFVDIPPVAVITPEGPSGLPGAIVALSGADSFEPNAGEPVNDRIVSYEWDLDDSDGLVQFEAGDEDASVTLPAGDCEAELRVALRVTDVAGNQNVAFAIVRANCEGDDDNDGLTTREEYEAGTDPLDGDTDDDGILDGAELDWDVDSDGDDAINALDPDSDNDGILDGTETGVVADDLTPFTDLDAGHFVPDADPDSTTNPIDADTDGGSVLDGVEDANQNGRVDAGERNPNVADDDVDGDNDGASFDDEIEAGTDPFDADSDDDGVLDGEEPSWNIDSDGDELINALDPDSDNDGVLDGTELGKIVDGLHGDTDVAAGSFTPDADPESTTDPLDSDTDDGGVSDGDEDTNHNGRTDDGEGDPNVGGDDDPDEDGLTNDEEAEIGTNPNNPDTDLDGLTDGAENAGPTDALDADTDDDGINDGDEMAGPTSPVDADSDDDGIQDGTETGVTDPVADPDSEGPAVGTDVDVFVPDADDSTTTDPMDVDTDDGGVNDGVEDANHNGAIDVGEGNPNAAGDDDPDGDGLTNDQEGYLGTDPSVADTDGDGIDDGDELGGDGSLDEDDTNPLDADTDDDGLADGDEDEPDALNPDSDEDGVQDGTEQGVTEPVADPDGDGPMLGTDLDVFVPDADPESTTDPLIADTDEGGVSDGDEDANGNGMVDEGEGDPNVAGDDDPDDDGLNNDEEDELGTDPNVADTDGDGLNDGDEVAAGTNPFDADTDDDGISDGDELGEDGTYDMGVDTNPLDADTDDDGIQDGTETGVSTPVVDPDGDGPMLGTDVAVFVPDADFYTTTNPLAVDTDDGGIPDGIEDANHNGAVEMGEGDPNDASDDDADDDGLTAIEEGYLGTDPNNPDTDGDGINDGDEVGNDGSVDEGDTNPLDADTDDDGLADGAENEPNPLDADSDDDGILDGTELGVIEPVADPDGDEGPMLGTDLDVFVPDADPETTTDPMDADTDHGGVSEGIEDANHNGMIDVGEGDPNDAGDDDPDGDGRTNDEEEEAGTDPNSDDSDGDGVSDGEEEAAGTDPLDLDTDDDGISDGDELGEDGVFDPETETDPTEADTDEDGILDGTETGVTEPVADPDGDEGPLSGTDLDVFVPDADPDHTSNPLDPDTDAGGVPDGDEDANHNGAMDDGEGDLNDPTDDDADNDGLTTAEEEEAGTDPNNADTDGDGVEDGDEIDNGTDPLDADTDDDGLGDGDELGGDDSTSPTNADTDGDGVQDGTERGVTEPVADPDGEEGPLSGTDLDVFVPDTDAETTTDPLDADSDDGGLSDGVEDANHNGAVNEGERDPNFADDDDDADGDGISDAVEEALGTDPWDADSDDDGIDDGVELGGDESLDEGDTDPLDADSDDDGLSDLDEVGDDGRYTPGTDTDPNDADTDDDGLEDGEEGPIGTDPLDDDSDDDGLGDGVETGVDGFDDDPDTRTDPNDADTDDDGLEDGNEDADGNGEIGAGETDPNDPDTDDGGLNDGDEVAAGDDPLDPVDDVDVEVGGGAMRGCDVAADQPAGPGALLLLGLIGLLALRRRKLAVTATLAAAALVSMPTQADAEGFDVQTFNPATDPGLDYLRQFSARPFEGTRFGFGFLANYASNPLVVRDSNGDRVASLVSDLLTADLQASVAFGKRYRIGINLPVVLWMDGDDEIAGLTSDQLPNGELSLGDLRLIPQVNLWSQHTAEDPSGLSLGVAADLRLPTGSTSSYTGEGWRLEPRALADYVFSSGWALGTNIGWVVRDTAKLRNVEINDVLTVGLSADIPVTDTVNLVPEVNSQLPVAADSFDAEETPLEALLGAHWAATKKLMITGGAGMGIVQGAGSPDWRVFLGLHGVFAAEKAVCAAGPEDMDGFEDGDGCADVDNDQDGILDTADKCPNDPEDKDGFEDADGCPDPDNDQDGILDTADKCPMEPEDKDTFEDENGCPDPDNDQDGILDAADKCPMEPEDKDDFEDVDGCPDPDNDQDGILDVDDKCPIDPENKNGFEDEDGCPDKQTVIVTCDKLVIDGKVYFETAKADIKKKSHSLLDEVAEVFNKHPEITKIRIEGHTDSRGSETYNQELSESRVKSVRAYMIDKGIDGGRMVATGFGETKPIDGNDTKAGRAANRRVEFVIVERKGCQKK